MTKELDSTMEFLKVVSDKNRLKILCMLRDGEKCVCDIWQNLKISQNLTSHHLKILKEFKLIESRKEGLRVYYMINDNRISDYITLFNNFFKS